MWRFPERLPLTELEGSAQRTLMRLGLPGYRLTWYGTWFGTKNNGGSNPSIQTLSECEMGARAADSNPFASGRSYLKRSGRFDRYYTIRCEGLVANCPDG